MNVLLLDQYSDPGGAQQALLEFLPAIRAKGWHAVVGLPGNGLLFDAIRKLGVQVERIDCWSHRSGKKYADNGSFAVKSVQLSGQIRKLAADRQADLVYLNGPRLVPAAALAALDCPVVFHSHSWLPVGRARNITGLALRWMGAKVIANCDFVAGQWRRFVPPRHISVILNGVEGPAAVQVPRPNGHPRVACIGRISPEKGQREFVAAAARIHAALPECRFLVYGDAMFGNVEAQRYAEEVRAAAAGLPIEFHGWVHDIYEALTQLDLVLVPSIGAEATTRVILEAFAAGVPVIAFDTGGISEVVSQGVTGILTNTVEEMARETIALLKSDPTHRIAMARAARTDWEQRFTKQNFHHQLLSALESIAPQRHGDTEKIH